MGKLTGTQDAFGQAMYDCYRGKKGFAVIERDDGYVDAFSETVAYWAEYKDWSIHERQAIKLVRGSALDVGCGVGRVSLYLQEKGLDVLGVDNSPLAAKVCRLRGVKQVRVLSLTELTSSLGVFDTILMYGNNFALFGSITRARWLLKRWRRMTSDHGRIVAETMDPYKTKEHHHLDYQQCNRKRGRSAGQVRIRIRYQKMATPWFDCLFLSKAEMRRLVAGTGWRVVRVIDSRGPKYIVVLEKVS